METKADHKIFVIGFNKTGTTSLKRAITMLGYSFLSENKLYSSKIFNEVNDKNFSSLNKHLDKFDAFKDRPWNHPGVYQYLDQKYENAKFILTLRDVDSWIKSYKKWNESVGLKSNSYYKTISKICYGVDDFLSDEGLMKEVYEKTNNNTIEYFKDKNNLLVLDLPKGDGWDKLCPFLNKSILTSPFPHANKNN
jgi:hypothetical protein